MPDSSQPLSQPAGSSPGGLAPWRGVLFLVLGWLGAAALVEGLLRAGAAPFWVVLADDATYGLLTLAVAGAAHWRTRRAPPAFVPFWRALTWALVFQGVAVVYLTFTHDILALPAPIPTFRHVGFLAGMVCLGWGVLHHPVHSYLPTQRIQALMNGLLISLAVFFIAWGGFLRLLVRAHATPGSPYALTLVYALLSCTLAALWLFQESRLNLTGDGPPVLMVKLGMLLMFIWWPLYSLGAIQGWYRQLGVAERVDILFSLRFLCFGLAALWPTPPRWTEHRPVRPRQSYLPQVPSVLAMAYAAWHLYRGEPFDLPMLLSGTLLVVLLNVRQFLTLRDLDDLSLDLEQRVRDRTEELLRSQRELAKSQRNQMIAGMTAGFAHDLKNMLFVIRNWVDLLRMDAQPPDLPQGLDAIELASNRALGLVQNVLAAGSQQDLAPEAFDLSEFLRTQTSTLKGVLGKRASVALVLPEEPLPVLMDPEKLGQALVNLASNAGDAMGPNGTLTLQAFLDPMEPFTVLEVMDTGGGISPENLERIFEPFFTTKPVGTGTGLGLSCVYGTILQSGGTMGVRSQVGWGTVFSLRLPQG